MPALICASSALVGKTTTRPPGMVKALTLEFNGVFDIALNHSHGLNWYLTPINVSISIAAN